MQSTRSGAIGPGLGLGFSGGSSVASYTCQYHHTTHTQDVSEEQAVFHTGIVLELLCSYFPHPRF